MPLSDQTKITRAMTTGLLTGPTFTVKASEKAVLSFLAQQSDYSWTIHGTYMTQRGWASLLGLAPATLSEALTSLTKNKWVRREKKWEGRDGFVPEDISLTPHFVNMATSWYDVIWSKPPVKQRTDDPYPGLPSLWLRAEREKYYPAHWQELMLKTWPERLEEWGRIHRTKDAADEAPDQDEDE